MGKLSRIFSVYNILAFYTALMVTYIYAPIIALAFFSFNAGAGIAFPFVGFSSFWYIGEIKLGLQSGVLHDGTMISTMLNSLQLGVVTMVVTTLLTIGAALALRKNFRGKDTMFYLLMMGIIVPGLIYAIGALVLYSSLGIQLSQLTALSVQVVWTLPFGLILMLARFDPDLLSYEQAARTLGASNLRVFRSVTFPLIFPQILATALFSFTLSFSELLRSFFVTGIASPTLPVYIFAQLTSQPATPKFYALGTITTAISITLLVVVGILMTRGNKRLF